MPPKKTKCTVWFDEKNWITLNEGVEFLDRESHGLGFRQYYTGRVQPAGSSDEQFEQTDNDGNPVELQ